MERIEEVERVTAWTVPKGLVPVQTFPPYILDYVSQYHDCPSLLSKVKKIPINRWSNQWNNRLNSMDVVSLRTIECLHLSVALRDSTIKSPRAGQGVFANRNFDIGETIGYYYGSLVYGDIGADRKLSKQYGSGLMAVTSTVFEKWAAQLQYVFTEVNGNKYKACITPAPWCVMRYINDYRYLDDDGASSEERESNPRLANVTFREKRTAVVNRDFELYDALAIVTLKEITVGSEFFLDYGDDYEFRHV